MISREADYAIRVMVYLSRRSASEKSFPTSLLSKELDIPYQFLRYIVKKMTAGELVVSKKGKNGGLRVARDPSDISLYDVITTVHHVGISLNKCTDDQDSCERSESCTVYKALLKTQHNLDENLKEVTFDKL